MRCELRSWKAGLGSRSSAEPLGFCVRVLQQVFYYGNPSAEPSCRPQSKIFKTVKQVTQKGEHSRAPPGQTPALSTAKDWRWGYLSLGWPSSSAQKALTILKSSVAVKGSVQQRPESNVIFNSKPSCTFITKQWLRTTLRTGCSTHLVQVDQKV